MSFRIDQLAVYNLATVGGSITAGSLVKSGGTSSQFLKADGSVDTNTYITGITSGMVTTALGYTPVPNTRTLTINGTTYDLTADRSWTISAPVSSVSGSGAGISVSPTTGAVVVSNTGVTSNVAGTGISVSGATGAVTITNTGVTSIVAGTAITVSGSTGAVTINNAGVTSLNGSTGALTGFATQSWVTSQGYITSASVGNGTLTLAVSGSGLSGSASFTANQSGATTFTVTSNATTAATANTIAYRDSGGDLYARYFFGSYVNTSDNDETGITRFIIKNGDNYHRSATPATAASVLSSSLSSYFLPLSGGTMTGTINSSVLDYAFVSQSDGTSSLWRGRILSKNASANVASFLGTYASIAGVFAHNNALTAWADLYVNTVDGSSGGTVRMPSSVLINGNQAIHAGNYNSYSPTLTGGGASGTWSINITGSAGSATTATYATNTSKLYSTDAGYCYGCANPYYGYLTYDGTRWLFQVSPGTPAAVRVAYADAAGSADNIDGWTFVNTGSNSATAADSINSNGISYVGTNISLFGQSDGALYSQAYSSSWQHQIYGDYRTGQIAIRGKNSGTWQSWRVVLDSSNYSSYISGAYLPYGNWAGNTGMNDYRLYLRTNGDNNHYLWNAADDWEELNAYEGTGFRITSVGGSVGVLYVYGSSNGGYTYSPYSFRAPIFYDSANTAYYGDFADSGTSVNIAGKITTAVSSGTIISHGAMTDAFGYNGSYGTYIGSPVGGTYYIYANGTFYDNGSIRTFLHTGNYNSYAPTLTGGGASGTWGINITGSASSATNADTVDGYHASTSTIGNYIVVRDGNGYIFGNYINMTDDGNPGGGTSISSFITKQGDNYYRSVSPTNAMVSIRGVASGTWGINITGNAATVGGVSESQIVYGGAGRASTSNGNMDDTNQKSGFYYFYNPTGAPYTEWWNWMTVAGNGWQSSNNYEFQLAHDFHSDNFYVRRMTNGTVYSWRSILTSANYNSYAPTLTGGGASGTWGINVTGTAGSTQRLDDVSNYSWSQSTLPATYSEGMQLSFVGPSAGEGSWQNYGTVINARTYSGGGGSLQMYVPYGPNNGGNALQVRFGDYSAPAYGNQWTAWKTLLQSDNYNSYAPTLTGGGASGTWGISITGNAGYASSAGNADTVDGFHAAAFPYRSGGSSGYYQVADWMQFNTSAGIYWPSYYGAHVEPNTSSSYGSINIRGSKNSWAGINFSDSNNNLMVNANESGIHKGGYGWQFRWYQGTMYCSRGTYGGGTEYTVLDSGNAPYAWNMNQYVRTTDNPTFNILTLSSYLTVGNGLNSSDIYMYDGDEGTRRIHCNSNRIGFLNQSASWGSYCDDTGNWITDYGMYASDWFRAYGDTGLYSQALWWSYT